MLPTFVETTEFTEWVGEYLTDDAYAALQEALAAKPDAGEVMRGCGGLRKVRAARSGRRGGKRGGVRVIYLHIPSVGRFYMLDVYAKGEADDLTAVERKSLASLAAELKAAARVEREERGAR